MSETNSLYDTAIYQAVAAAGDIPSLAKALGVSRQVIYVWLKRGFAPPLRAIQIEEMFKIPRADLMDPMLRAILSAPSADAALSNGRVPYRPYRTIKEPIV